MQFIKRISTIIFFISPISIFAQSTFLQQGSKDIHFVERLEIKQQTNTNINYSTIKPYNRRDIVKEVQFLDSARKGFTDSITGIDKFKEWTDLNLSNVDEYNLQSFLMNNSEWVNNPDKESYLSKKPFLKNFFIKKNNFFEIDKKDFAIIVNPIFQFQQAAETGASGQVIFQNSRGLTARGHLSQKIGFSTTFIDNQERGPLYVQNWITANNAVQGNGYYKPFNRTAVDYIDARGYITFNAAKFVDIQLGHDKHFWGNGYRSMYLSDWGANMFFLKLNTKFWKVNYTNLFTELVGQFKATRDFLRPKKYMVAHHLGINLNKWLNVGVFESIVFSRNKQFELQYLNPIIFYRSIESSLGSPDNSMLGIDAKANIAHRLQFYGQFVLDEFVKNNFFKKTGWWGNKWSGQLGMKYLDAFGVFNLDLQLETNIVRPFTYARDSATNYTHYNQPLAHPLGSNFREIIFGFKYQPANKLLFSGRAIYYTKGLDSSSQNFGGDVFREVNLAQMRNPPFGYYIGNGKKATAFNFQLHCSYELKENFYFDLSFMNRNYKVKDAGSSNTTLITTGIRWNMWKRDYDY